jgi:TolA-binding protein
MPLLQLKRSLTAAILAASLMVPASQQCGQNDFLGFTLGVTGASIGVIVWIYKQNQNSILGAEVAKLEKNLNEKNAEIEELTKATQIDKIKIQTLENENDALKKSIVSAEQSKSEVERPVVYKQENSSDNVFETPEERFETMKKKSWLEKIPDFFKPLD